MALARAMDCRVPGHSHGFCPGDAEIMLTLLNKVTSQPLPFNQVIECDVYGDEKIWQNIFDERSEESLFFFAKLENKCENEVAASGSWRAQKNEEIRHCTQHIGSKTSFPYLGKEGRWSMVEYRLDGCFLMNLKDNDYVLCRIMKMRDRD